MTKPTPAAGSSSAADQAPVERQPDRDRGLHDAARGRPARSARRRAAPRARHGAAPGLRRARARRAPRRSRQQRGPRRAAAPRRSARPCHPASAVSRRDSRPVPATCGHCCTGILHARVRFLSRRRSRPSSRDRRARSPTSPARWAYEPKWDGFRVIAFVDGDDVELRSRNDRPLSRYFPELSLPGRALRARRRDRRARRRWRRRVRRAAAADPPGRLARRAHEQGDAGERRRVRPARARRPRAARAARSTSAAACSRSSSPPPPSSSVRRCEMPPTAEAWLHEYEGVIAKRLDGPYLPGERKGMLKVRRQRTIDCVVAGYRPGKAEGTVGSLMLGLYDDAGKLVVVGHTSGFSAREKRELARAPATARDRGARDRRAESLDSRTRSRVGRARAGARRRGHLRPRERRSHPPRREHRALAHGSRSRELPARAVRGRQLSVRPDNLC